MKNYTITVSGKAYVVTVEEGTVSNVAAAPAAPVAALTAPTAPAAAPAPAAVPVGAAGSVSVSAPMPGKVVAVKAAAGQAVKKDDVILVLKVVRMEDDIMTPQNGTITDINASTSDSVESGIVLVILD